MGGSLRLWLTLLIISGILFGQWVGTIISVISISIGALILYTIGNYFFKDLVEKTLEKKFQNIFSYFKKMNFIIFLFIDLWWS